LVPERRAQVAQVDGGNGHSGVRSSELHFGLGAAAEGTQVPVEVRWRDRQGSVHQAELRLPAGWHSVELGEDARLMSQEAGSESGLNS
jgi:hypothetical protein